MALMQDLKTSLLVTVFLLAGCQAGNPAPTPEAKGPPIVMTQLRVTADAPKDAKEEVPLLVCMDVWELSVPLGTISGNEGFWKRINEQGVDVGVYDRLFKNGIRVGIAPQREWEYFKQIIDQNPAIARKVSFRGNDTRAAELDIAKEIPSQTLFYFDQQNQLTGRSYDRCENFLALTYQSIPRRTGDVRIKLCPAVRTMREQFEFTVTNEERAIQYVRPERVYDLSLEADVPLEHFLVVAPSSEAQWASSVGGTFLIKNDPAARSERVFLLVPRPYRMDDPPPTIAKARGELVQP